MKPDRFFKVTITQGYRETVLDYQTGINHSGIALRLPLPNKRITNPRYREIETTGWYYSITEQRKGGKAFIFEILK